MTSTEILAHQLPALCSETNYLIVLNLSFFLCKMGGITMSSSSEDFHTHEVSSKLPGTEQVLG